MKKTICDVCDKQLEDYDLYKVTIKRDGYRTEELDFCHRHYKAFKKIFKFLKKENKNGR